MSGVLPVAEALRRQGRSCEALGSPMYAGLLGRLAEDHDRGGPTAAVLAGEHETDPPERALALRLLGSVHRLVLERRAGALAASYPSVGGTWDLEAGTAAFLALLESEPSAVREWLDRPPQTNEVGRAAALIGGLLHLPAALRLPVRLVELGSSAGLNLRADRFRIAGAHGTHGDPSSPVVLADAWSGERPPAWPDLRFVDPVGCDPRPIDPRTTQGRLALTAYVWPDQRERLERLRGALAVAQEVPATVVRRGAAELLDALELRGGATTVVWHSVVRQYLDRPERLRVEARLEELGRSATPSSPLAHLAMEPEPGVPGGFPVTLTTWPGGQRRRVGTAAPHGVPVTWGPGSSVA